MSSNQQQTLSASVTRILTLSGFPAELKTRDLQAAFAEWESDKGGFKVKWIDDVSAMLVFADASTAKRAYLSSLLHPPTTLLSTPPKPVHQVIKPYDGSDAHLIISSIQQRQGSISTMPSQAPLAGGFIPGHRKNSSSVTSTNFVLPPARGHGRSASTSSVGGSGGYGMNMFGRSSSSQGESAIAEGGDGPALPMGRMNGGGGASRSSGSWSRASVPSIPNLPPLQSVNTNTNSNNYQSFQSSLSPIASESPITPAPRMRFGMSSPPLSTNSSTQNSSGEEDLKIGGGGGGFGHRGGSSSINWGKRQEPRKSISGGL